MSSNPPRAARTPPDAVPTDGYGLRLRVLGPAALVAVAPDGGTVERLGPGKPLALLVRVAMAGDRGIAREALGALLWSAAEPERQRQSVRQAMLQLRRAAGRDLFATTASGALVLAHPLPSDLDALLARLTAGDRTGALALAGGVFLADLQPAGAPGFERWADFERVRIGALVAGAREAAAREALEGGRCRDARRLATIARQEAPDPEAAWGLEIEAALADGDPTAAGMSAEALAAWLRDMEREPAAGTRALLARARASLRERAAAAPVGAGAGEIAWHWERRIGETIGREAAVAALQLAWRRAATGCVAVEVDGPAGIGKTRLLRDVAQRLRAGGACVVAIAAARSARAVPYALLADLVAALATAPGALGVSTETATTLVAFLPALRTTYRGVRDADLVQAARDDQRDIPLRRALALADLVAAVSEEHPVALLFDDMQWCDPASATVLRTAHARCARAHALLCTTRRTSADTPPPPADDDDAPIRITLGPLDVDAVRTLLTSMATLPAPPWGDTLAAALHAATAGVPQALRDTLVALDTASVLRIEDGAWRCEAPAALADRLAALAAAPAARPAAPRAAPPPPPAPAPQPRRMRWGRRAMAPALLVATVLVGTGLASLRATTAPAAPARLALVVTPLVAVAGHAPVPAPVIEVLDGEGRRLAVPADSVRITSLTPGVVVRGDTAAPLVGGQAVFKRSVLGGTIADAATLRFRYRDLPPLDVRVTTPGPERSSLRLGRVRLDGQTQPSATGELEVAPGAAIRGDVELVYSALWAMQPVLLGMTPTWGVAATAHRTIGPVSSPAVATATHAPLDLVAPTTPGRYAIVFAMHAARSGAHLVSGTDDDRATPVWGDGNDVADWTPAMWREARRDGRVRTRITLPPGDGGEARSATRHLPATVLVVVVRGAPGTTRRISSRPPPSSVSR